MEDLSPSPAPQRQAPPGLADLAAQARQRQANLPDGPPVEPQQAKKSDQNITVEPARVCRDCRYDLTGIDWSPAECPECGREFDPNDESTTRGAGEMGPVRSFINRYGTAMAAVLLLLVAFNTGILPRPADLRDWRLWTWMGDLYGVEKVPGNAYRGWQRPFRGAPDGRVYWWGGRPWRVRALDREGALVWEVERINEREWTVDIREPGVRYGTVLGAFSAIKPEMFGVTYDQANASTIDEAVQREGSTAEIFGWLVREANVQIQPLVYRPDQSYVWYFDDSSGQMRWKDLALAIEEGMPISAILFDPKRGGYRTDLHAAIEDGLEIVIDSSHNDARRPMVPRPEPEIGS